MDAEKDDEKLKIKRVRTFRKRKLQMKGKRRKKTNKKECVGKSIRNEKVKERKNNR